MAKSKRTLEGYLDDVAEGVCLLLGYPTDITSPQYHYMKKAYRDGVSADDHAIELAAEIARADRRREAIGC